MPGETWNLEPETWTYRVAAMTKLSVACMAGVAATLALLVGCELSNSPNDTVRNVSVDFTGFYDNDGAPLTTSQTGADITEMNLIQTGDRLEAVDNNGIIFKGTLGEVTVDSGGQASSIINLSGRTTANGDVTISGTIIGQQNQGVIHGTWIEPTLFGQFLAKGTISTINTNSGGGTDTNGTSDVSIDPASATLTNPLDTESFTASGGSGSYEWQLANSSGSLNNNTGRSVIYTRTGSGNNTISVRDSSDNSKTDSASITQP